MADFEKVTRGLEACACDSRVMQCANCSYHTDKSRCVTTLMRDTLALLREYDTALKLMVLQYCTLDEGFYNRFMSAGEEAFRVLGIENGQSTNGVWEKWFQTNERGEDNA